MKKNLVSGLIPIVLALAALSAPAVQTVYTQYQSEPDFKTGEPNGVIIASDGSLTLAHQVEPVMTSAEEWVLNDLIRIDARIYLATSGTGGIFVLDAAGVSGPPCQIYGNAEGDARHVLALGRDGHNRLLAGTGGAQAQLIRFDEHDSHEILWENNEIKYIWAIVTGPGGRIYLATGPTGQILTLDPDGTNPQTLYRAGEKNILTLALAPTGRLYAGGDEFGLIYCIDPGTGKTTIAYDTGHQEISRLIVDESGTLYAATSDTLTAKAPVRLILSGEEDDSRNEEAAGRPARKSAPRTPAVRMAGSPSQDFEANNGEEGNEVFKIAPDGFVSSLFSQPVAIHAMTLDPAGHLLIGTGDFARLIRIDPVTRQAAVLFEEPDCSQITGLLADPAGNLTWLGLSNPLRVMHYRNGYRASGFYRSKPVDAQQVSQWGLIQIEAGQPASTRLAIQTRSGNTADPLKGGWQEWTPPVPVERLNPVQSPPGRFLQFQLLFTASDPGHTPILHQVKLASQAPNLAPTIKQFACQLPEPQEKSPAKPDPTRLITLTWQAQDQNDDTLRYDLYLRPVESEEWLLLEKELEETSFAFDRMTLADGYYDLKVVASDSPDNPADSARNASRISAPVLIDNTPPEIVNLDWRTQDQTVVIELTISDQLSVIESLDYTLNCRDAWQKTLPLDGIFDSGTEKLRITCKPAVSGRHLLCLRVSDSFGNTHYRNLSIEN